MSAEPAKAPHETTTRSARLEDRILPPPGGRDDYSLFLRWNAPPKPALDGGVAFLRGRALRVLVVDDVADAALTAAAMVRLWGHEPLVALDGSSALAACQTYLPDVLLLDIGLPGGPDGYEVARRVRQLPDMARALIIAVTGFGGERHLRLSREAGIDRHLVKPVEPEELRGLFASHAAAQGPVAPRPHAPASGTLRPSA
jgi:CheY-like chemotaxis protein